MTVSETVNGLPAVLAYVCCAVGPVAVPPSPNVQA